MKRITLQNSSIKFLIMLFIVPLPETKMFRERKDKLIQSQRHSPPIEAVFCGSLLHAAQRNTVTEAPCTGAHIKLIWMCLGDRTQQGSKHKPEQCSTAALPKVSSQGQSTTCQQTGKWQEQKMKGTQKSVQHCSIKKQNQTMVQSSKWWSFYQ